MNSEPKASSPRKQEKYENQKYENLIARCKALAPAPCTRAYPCDKNSLRGAVESLK